MDRSRSHAATISRVQDDSFDSLTRSLSTTLPRRGVLGLLAAALVTGGVGALAAPGQRLTTAQAQQAPFRSARRSRLRTRHIHYRSELHLCLLRWHV